MLTAKQDPEVLQTCFDGHCMDISVGCWCNPALYASCPVCHGHGDESCCSCRGNGVVLALPGQAVVAMIHSEDV